MADGPGDVPPERTARFRIAMVATIVVTSAGVIALCWWIGRMVM